MEQLVISPGAAELETGDTLTYLVELLPENATIRDYWYMYEGDAGVFELDSVNSRIFARQAGTAGLIVHSVSGGLSDTLQIIVNEPVYDKDYAGNPSFLVYPNPNEGLLRLECGAPVKVEMQLLDLDGKLLLSCEYRNHKEIDTSHLAAGTYLLVQKWKDRTERHKLIIY